MKISTSLEYKFRIPIQAWQTLKKKISLLSIKIFDIVKTFNNAKLVITISCICISATIWSKKKELSALFKKKEKAADLSAELKNFYTTTIFLNLNPMPWNNSLSDYITLKIDEFYKFDGYNNKDEFLKMFRYCKEKNADSYFLMKRDWYDQTNDQLQKDKSCLSDVICSLMIFWYVCDYKKLISEICNNNKFYLVDNLLWFFEDIQKNNIGESCYLSYCDKQKFQQNLQILITSFMAIKKILLKHNITSSGDKKTILDGILV